MKKYSTRIAAFLLCFALIFTAAGCTVEQKATDDTAPSAGVNEIGGESFTDYDTAPDGTTLFDESRMIIKTAHFSLETKDYQTTLTALQQKITELNSYIQYSESWGDAEYGNAYTSVTLRVPANQYHAFCNFIPELGNVTSKFEGGEDVTEQYFDASARLVVLQAQETRLLDMLSAATTIDEMLQIESHLASVRTDIEVLTGTIKRLDSQTEMSTITLEISQAVEYTPQIEPSFGDQLGEAFQDSWDTFVDFCKWILFLFIRFLPFLIILVIVLVIVLLLVRRSSRRKPAFPPAPLPPSQQTHPTRQTHPTQQTPPTQQNPPTQQTPPTRQ